jgi:diguanylate cyclase (GGDEF)-like protein/PAS domain S-box-containing protein
MYNSSLRVLLAEAVQVDSMESWLTELASYQLQRVHSLEAVCTALKSGQIDLACISLDLFQPSQMQNQLQMLRDILALHPVGLILLATQNVEQNAEQNINQNADHCKSVWKDELAETNWPEFEFLFQSQLTGEQIPDERLKQAIRSALQRSQLLRRLAQVLTEKQQMSQALAQIQLSETCYKLALEASADGLWDWQVSTGTLLLSPQWKAMLGYAETEIEDRPESWFERIHPEDLYWVKRELTAHLEANSPRFESEHRMLHRDGSYRWVWNRGIALRAADEVVRVVGLQTDITHLKQVETQQTQDSVFDPLTGLPNRVALMERLRHAGEMASLNPDYLVSILFIDLDRFKMINDSLGHAIGDQLLCEISDCLSACVRPNDTVSRLGGDEFVILLEDIKTQDNATMIAQRILQALTNPFNLGEREIFMSASIGITFSLDGFHRPEDLLRDADLAMYRAKVQGRGRYAIFHPKMYSSAVALLEMETDLRRAVDRQELELYYQPIVSLRSNRLVGFEALIRWHHPQQGLISPAQFVPIAEETGLIGPMGRWILRQACTQLRQWQIQFPDWPPLTVNVNLSSKQFSPHLSQQVEQILAETGLEAQYLKLEITESVLMSHAESAIATLTQLKQLGIQLAIDDFGTGYSSLSYLHRLPIDTLKVDRSFIQRVDSDGEQLAIVRTIITLAWNLGMEVVAEGVETRKQLAQLQSLRCEYAQGYLFSKPRDVIAVETLLNQELEQGQFRLGAKRIKAEPSLDSLPDASAL